jgi:RimJ/RimL family protein N-acetyltransferase
MRGIRSRRPRCGDTPSCEIHVRLEPCRDEDIMQLLHWVGSANLMALWAGATFDWPLTAMQLRSYLQAARRPGSRMRIYRVVDDDDAWVGHLDFCPSARNDGSAQIGRVIVGDPRMRGRGVGRQMMAQILDVAFGELGLQRVDLHVARANTPGRRCYRGLGFRKARSIPHERVAAAGAYPTIRMAIDRETWRRKRREL